MTGFAGFNVREDSTGCEYQEGEVHQARGGTLYRLVTAAHVFADNFISWILNCGIVILRVSQDVSFVKSEA